MTETNLAIDDEIVSAVLDGEATAEEAALVWPTTHTHERGRPPSKRCVTRWPSRCVPTRPVTPRRGPSRVRPRGPPPPRHRARVPRAGRRPAHPRNRSRRPRLHLDLPSPAPRTAPVVDLATRRSRRSLQILSAAAAIVVVVGLLAAVRIGQKRGRRRQPVSVRARHPTTTAAPDLVSGGAKSSQETPTVNTNGQPVSPTTASVRLSGGNPSVPPRRPRRHQPRRTTRQAQRRRRSSTSARWRRAERADPRHR